MKMKHQHAQCLDQRERRQVILASLHETQESVLCILNIYLATLPICTYIVSCVQYFVVYPGKIRTYAICFSLPLLQRVMYTIHNTLATLVGRGIKNTQVDSLSLWSSTQWKRVQYVMEYNIELL